MKKRTIIRGRRILSLLLAAALTVCIGASAAFAQEAPGTHVHTPDDSLKRTVRSDPEGGVLVTFDDPAYPPLHKDGRLPEGYENAVIEAGRYLLNDGTQRTCADGETRCAVCGELLERAIPHIWDKGEVREDETSISGLVRVHTCLFCGEEKTVFPTICPPRYGDVDQDGLVSPEDARLTLRAAVGLAHFAPGSYEFRLADYDQDARITPADARMILRNAVGLPN